MRTDSSAKFIRLCDIVAANRDQAAIANLEFTMKLDQSFMLPSVLWAVTAAAEDDHHRILSLQFRELPPFRGVIGKLVIGKLSSGNDVRSH
jgi:hypothetical protein